MLDIVFLVIIFLVFIYGLNSYDIFENFETPENELYQTEIIKNTTDLLKENLTKILKTISDLVSGLQNKIQEKVNGVKNYVERCVGCVKFCGREPYWCNGCCNGPSYPCDWGCKKRVNGVCVDAGFRDTCRDRIGCTQWRDKCTAKLPKWKCSTAPNGFKIPSFPTGWTGISEKSC